MRGATAPRLVNSGALAHIGRAWSCSSVGILLVKDRMRLTSSAPSIGSGSPSRCSQDVPAPSHGFPIAKAEAAAKDRLTKAITYWDPRAEELKLQERARRPNARLNSGEARKAPMPCRPASGYTASSSSNTR